MNLTFRPAEPSDVDSAIPLIYSSAEDCFEIFSLISTIPSISIFISFVRSLYPVRNMASARMHGEQYSKKAAVLFINDFMSKNSVICL